MKFVLSSLLFIGLTKMPVYPLSTEVQGLYLTSKSKRTERTGTPMALSSFSFLLTCPGRPASGTLTFLFLQ